MAQARPVADLDPATPFAEAAARVVETRAEELIAHSSGVLDTEQIEGVHDMRVATRRLRAALEVFAPCFPKAEHRRLLKEVKGIADALGERRDRDVAIAALQSFAASLPAPDRPGVRSLTDLYAAEQRQANEALAPIVATERLERLEARVATLVGAARERAAQAPGEPGPPEDADRIRARDDVADADAEDGDGGGDGGGR